MHRVRRDGLDALPGALAAQPAGITRRNATFRIAVAQAPGADIYQQEKEWQTTATTPPAMKAERAQA